MTLKSEYQKRRNALMNSFDKGPILITGAKKIYRNTDVEFEFRQNAHTLYFSNINIPNVALLLLPKTKKFILYAANPTIHSKIWEAKQLSLKQLQKKYNANKIFPIELLKEHIKKYKRVYTPQNSKELLNQIVKLRLIKSSFEIKQIQKAIAITKKTFDYISSMKKIGLKEYEIVAQIDFIYRKNNVTFAYLPIVTTQGNILHNNNYNNTIKKNQLLLIDAGCEINGYASDITRTFPTSNFTKEQKKIYNLVLQTQQKCIEMLKPNIDMVEIHNLAVNCIVDGLIKLNILKGEKQQIMQNKTYAIFFPHSLSHHLGLDVHDVNDAKKKLSICSKLKESTFARILKPGFVITIEPGIYFIDELLNNSKYYKKHEKNINLKKARTYIKKVSGIRIEDNIAITKNGYMNLSKTISK